MKRSEFNLLVENWRKFLKDGVIQEQTEDFDYYADVDDQSDSDVKTANKDSESGVEDILSPGTMVTVVDLKGVSFEVNGKQEEYNENPATRRNLSNSWGMQVDPEEKLAADGIIVGYDSATKTYSVGPEDVSPDWPVLTNCVFGKNIIHQLIYQFQPRLQVLKLLLTYQLIQFLEQ